MSFMSIEIPSPIKRVELKREFTFKYSICTLVTNLEEYLEMVKSFVNQGFNYNDCEFLYIDNSKMNTFDAFAGFNRFLSISQGEHIIICHQDILLSINGRSDLEARMEEITKIDPKWAILSNAGGVNLKHTAMHVTHGNGEFLEEPLLPLKMQTVDESFILIKSEANLAMSSNLEGFHLYGTDLCLIARVLGYNAYAINFRFIHKSTGNANKSFYNIKKALITKYQKAFAPRFMGTTITRFYLAGTKCGSLIGNSVIIMFLARQYVKVFFPKRKYRV